MHPIVVVIFIFFLILSVLIMCLLDLAERGMVSFIDMHLVIFPIIVLILYLLTRIPTQSITKICIGMSGSLFFLSFINLKTNASEKSKDDFRIWSGHAMLLMFGTAAISLMVYVPSALSELSGLLGLFGSAFYGMFLKTPRQTQ